MTRRLTEPPTDETPRLSDVRTSGHQDCTQRSMHDCGSAWVSGAGIRGMSVRNVHCGEHDSLTS